MSCDHVSRRAEGAIKIPIFQTSTFTFASTEEEKGLFEIAFGLCEKGSHKKLGLINSIINNPHLEVLADDLIL